MTASRRPCTLTFHKGWNFCPKHVKKHLLMPYLQHASPSMLWPVMPLKLNSWSWRQDTQFLQAVMREYRNSPLGRTQPESADVAEKKNLRMATRHSPLLLMESTEPTAANVISFGSYHTPHTVYCLLKGRIVLPLMGSLFSHQFVNKKVKLMTNNPL